MILKINPYRLPCLYALEDEMSSFGIPTHECFQFSSLKLNRKEVDSQIPYAHGGLYFLFKKKDESKWYSKNELIFIGYTDTFIQLAVREKCRQIEFTHISWLTDEFFGNPFDKRETYRYLKKEYLKNPVKLLKKSERTEEWKLELDLERARKIIDSMNEFSFHATFLSYGWSKEEIEEAWKERSDKKAMKERLKRKIERK